MKLINQYSRCRGVTVLRWRSWLVELWRCPFGEVVAPHTHPGQDSWLLFLAGECSVGKKETNAKEIAVTGKWYNPPTFYISGDTPHWIKRISDTTWFINISHTRVDRNLKSAADNFVATTI